ncbi:MAG: Re/Si-specific NAD(P)(+) transhydrogenase subunit alpha [Planctomycetota bacterium]|nr:MAG: Re/Si-specific NAD(P)(+) transhydrogenase subunit alpha [Planctomycetota bacterium]
MKVGVPTETYPGERRVALIPDVIPALEKQGHTVLIQAGAGESAGYPDPAYRDKGARVVEDRAEIFREADVVLQVRGLGANPEAGADDLEHMRPGLMLVGMFDPLGSPEWAKKLAERKVTAFAMELMPRITRAQSMDVLSSQATVSGYKAVLLAANLAPRMFPMFMTAAGTITAAHVFVIGAGVAGLQAIATSRRLGAVVQAYDVRPAVKEQVESLGAKFVEMGLETQEAEDKSGYAKDLGEDFVRRQRELMTRVVAESHAVITTAAIPGKRSPVLITGEMVRGMMPGSVIVDLAAERGGNCELTRPDETVVEHGVTIVGPTNLPATVPLHASQMYARNLVTFLKEITRDGSLALDLENEVHAGTLLTREGKVCHPRVRELLGLPPLAGEKPSDTKAAGG